RKSPPAVSPPEPVRPLEERERLPLELSLDCDQDADDPVAGPRYGPLHPGRRMGAAGGGPPQTGNGFRDAARLEHLRRDHPRRILGDALSDAHRGGVLRRLTPPCVPSPPACQEAHGRIIAP